jgi:hypothetical protein
MIVEVNGQQISNTTSWPTIRSSSSMSMYFVLDGDNETIKRQGHIYVQITKNIYDGLDT